MTTPAEAAVRALAERDGCPCPPWFRQCAHFNGLVIAINDEDAAKGSELLNGPHLDIPGFNVTGPAPLVPCICGGHMVVNDPSGHEVLTLAAARAEFELRERLLLGREEA